MILLGTKRFTLQISTDIGSIPAEILMAGKLFEHIKNTEFTDKIQYFNIKKNGLHIVGNGTLNFLDIIMGFFDQYDNLFDLVGSEKLMGEKVLMTINAIGGAEFKNDTWCFSIE